MFDYKKKEKGKQGSYKLNRSEKWENLLLLLTLLALSVYITFLTFNGKKIDCNSIRKKNHQETIKISHSEKN